MTKRKGEMVYGMNPEERYRKGSSPSHIVKTKKKQKRCEDCIFHVSWLQRQLTWHSPINCNHCNAKFEGFTCPETKACYIRKWYKFGRTK